jgi:hypothetical protein
LSKNFLFFTETPLRRVKNLPLPLVPPKNVIKGIFSPSQGDQKKGKEENSFKVRAPTFRPLRQAMYGHADDDGERVCV